jgi:hypothetical protein
MSKGVSPLPLVPFYGFRRNASAPTKKSVDALRKQQRSDRRQLERDFAAGKTSGWGS